MEGSLRELEGSLQSAGEKFDKADNAYKAAQEKTAAAVQARDDILYKYGLGNPSAQCMAELALADQAIKDAQDEQNKAEDTVIAAFEEAQAATEMVNEKKKSLRMSRNADMTYVVYQARLECNFGLRESYLTLESTHGVMTKKIPQMTVKDSKLNKNIINFGGCRSWENDSVKEAAERARDNAKARIKEDRDWRDVAAGIVTVARKSIIPIKTIIEDFCKKDEEDVDDSLLAECVGQCTACFPEFTAWENGHTKVTINGKPVLLRRCTMRCNYGGRITILLSGQPE